MFAKRWLIDHEPNLDACAGPAQTGERLHIRRQFPTCQVHASRGQLGQRRRPQPAARRPVAPAEHNLARRRCAPPRPAAASRDREQLLDQVAATASPAIGDLSPAPHSPVSMPRRRHRAGSQPPLCECYSKGGRRPVSDGAWSNFSRAGGGVAAVVAPVDVLMVELELPSGTYQPAELGCSAARRAGGAG